MERIILIPILVFPVLVLSWLLSAELVVPSMTPVIDVNGLTAMLTSIITVDGILVGLVTLPVAIYRSSSVGPDFRILYASTLISASLLVFSIVASLVSLGEVHSIEFVNQIASTQQSAVQVPYVTAFPYMIWPVVGMLSAFLLMILALFVLVILLPPVQPHQTGQTLSQ